MWINCEYFRAFVCALFAGMGVENGIKFSFDAFRDDVITLRICGG